MMPFDNLQSKPLVSVIVPCYNQGKFLAEALRSIAKQTYHNIETIVVDDGSTDNTCEVAESFPHVRYLYQPNGGLSAARNSGISKSRGLFLVFLDADDVLYPQAVETQLRLLLQHPAWAFVSGGHDKVDEWLYPLGNDEDNASLPERPYLELLRGNYIGMHAAVMYRCRVFDSFRFDTTLEACEDYDLYLKVTRKYPVGCHAEKVAAYRHHGQNMSAALTEMLRCALKVHARQRGCLKNDEEERAWKEGINVWRHYYGDLLYKQHFRNIEDNKRWPSLEEMRLMAGIKRGKLRHFMWKKIRHNLFDSLKTSLPDPVLKALHRFGIYRKYTPPPGKIEPGDFDRVTPFSMDFGFDRGGAIDRFYIEQFLEEYKTRVGGRVLEIGDNAYTLRFGGDKVLRSDILHVDRQNAYATYIGDITNIPEIPSEAFDCIIFTQTLHLVYDFTSALKTCYRILKPGGCLLLTVPGISHIDRGLWRDYWLWSFTDKAITRLMAETFNGSKVEVKTYGNVYVAAAFLYGMGLPEFKRAFLVHHDPSYQVIVAAAAIKH